MKQYTNIINIALAAFLLSACSKADALPEGEERGPQVTELQTSLGSINAGETTRATPSYSVNTDADPTKTAMESRTAWKMDVQIYNGGNPYTPGGTATYTYNSKWETTSRLCFPNYTKQKIKATLHPKDWTTSTKFITDQSKNDNSEILKQDILIESNFATLFNPAKTIKIPMKHANSMLDFIVSDITDDQIKTVTVTIGDNKISPYKPYKISTSPVEYLLIVPITTAATAASDNPIIEITTNNGSVYKQQIHLIGATNGDNVISNYTVNTCYCFTLRGLELLLSPITVTDWATGEAVAGDYIAVTAYPTFRGTPNNTYYVYYDNCLKDDDGNPKMQKIIFNSRGECTLKPDGRIITHIGTTPTLTSSKALDEADKLLLSGMIVDLNNIISLIP